MADLDLRERRALCDLFDELGPDAPTLCEGWSTAELAAHLVVRERDPLGAPGIVLGGKLGPVGDRLASVTERHMQRQLEKGYPSLVELIRTGPPPPLNFGPLRARMNLGEFVVHHEDVRRANGQGPRPPDAELDGAVWNLVRVMAKLLLRKARPVGVVLRTPAGQEAEVVKGEHLVTVTGAPVELILWAYGRGDVAEVDFDGAPEAVAALRATSFGI